MTESPATTVAKGANRARGHRAKSVEPVVGWVERERILEARLAKDRAARWSHGVAPRVEIHEAAVNALGSIFTEVAAVSEAQTALIRAIQAIPRLTPREKDALEEIAFAAILAERRAVVEAWLDAQGYAALDALTRPHD
jgi:hypothetical protein